MFHDVVFELGPQESPFKFGFIVRMDGFKLDGGEWFKEGFRKLLSLE